MTNRIATPGTAEVILYWTVGLGWMALLGWLAAWAATVGGFEYGTGARIGIVALTVSAAASGLWLMSRFARTRLTISDLEVEIRNPLRTVVIRRSDLRRVSVSPDRKWIIAETSSGESIPIWAISSGLIWTIKARAAKWNADLGLGG